MFKVNILFSLVTNIPFIHSFSHGNMLSGFEWDIHKQI